MVNLYRVKAAELIIILIYISSGCRQKLALSHYLAIGWAPVTNSYPGLEGELMDLTLKMQNVAIKCLSYTFF